MAFDGFSSDHASVCSSYVVFYVLVNKTDPFHLLPCCAVPLPMIDCIVTLSDRLFPKKKEGEKGEKEKRSRLCESTPTIKLSRFAVTIGIFCD